MYKSGFVAIVGSPNAGKSSIINALLDQKIAIVSDKVQTTRDMIRGIYTDKVAQTQIVFVDTPGFHKPQNKLQNYMNAQIDGALNDIEAVVYVLDGEIGIRKKEKEIIERLSHIKLPKIAIVNKIDLIGQEKTQKIVDQLSEYNIFNHTLAISVKEEFNVKSVIDLLTPHLVEGVQYYEDDQVSDFSEAFIISEIIREKVLKYTMDEVPHSIGVKIDQLEEDDEIINIAATIYVERNSQKGIVIGNQGKMLQKIGKDARLELAKRYDKRIYLENHVKVLKNWGRKIDLLKEVGYDFD